MRISRIAIEGFRGVRSPLDLKIPSGFAVVTGRNGAGKSTLCDAVEFALTGQLGKYGSAKEKGESIDEYVWWRGRVPALDHHVSIYFIDSAGQEHRITRRPDGVEIPDTRDLKELFCAISASPIDPLEQICRTSIIRDETLSAYSIDLEEAKRYLFVRAVLGTDSVEHLDERSKAVVEVLRNRRKLAEEAYQRVRSEIGLLLTQISETRLRASEATDVEEARATLRRLVPGIPSDQALERAAHSRLAEVRRTIDAIMRLNGIAQSLRSELEDAARGEQQARRAALQARQAALSEAVKHSREQIDSYRAQEHVVDTRGILSRHLAALYEHGTAVGLQDHACPLCQSPLSDEQFQRSLDDLSKKIQAAERARVRILEQHSGMRVTLDHQLRDLTSVEHELIDLDARERVLQNRISGFDTEAARYNLPAFDHYSEQITEPLIAEHTALARTLENSLSVVAASLSMDLIAELEERVRGLQDQSLQLERDTNFWTTAEQRAKTASAGIRRSVGELIEERLAALQPLLKELYARLRPHAEWDDVQYHMRGELRRFLSLEVGGDINPRFTFSSGQKRAAGLAFLLALHLSRPWCHLRALVLDDPIQHIDDYRALHLVELLASIRRGGQQIFCTVEDPALAELLCRRLRGEHADEGVLFTLAYVVGEGVTLLSSEKMHVPSKEFLLSA